MKQAMGTLAVLLITASAWAQNPATVLQNSKANAQSVQVQTQTHSNAVLVKAKEPVHTAAQAARPAVQKPVAQKSVAQKTVAQKPSAQKVVAQKSAPAKAAQVVPNAKVSSAKPAPAEQKAKQVPVVQAKSVPAQKQQVAVKPVALKSVSTKPAVIALKPVATKAPAKAVPEAKTPVAAKPTAVSKITKEPVAAKPTVMAKVDVKDTNAKPEGSEKEKKEVETSTKLISGVGKRDPFVSPVVSQSMSGSGCSVGKKCLAIDQITIRGVVKSDSGMIAVVVNALDKAYFLRENDPVFNGYVEKITEDSIIFKEMYQDKLGKSFTRDVTKRIQAPVV